MASAVSIDPTTGLKIFRTRAAQIGEIVADGGFSVVKDDSLRTLPAAPAGAVFDAEEQARYRQNKEERAQSSAGYVALEGQFASYLEDVHASDRVEREALTDDCEIMVIGAGIGALLLWHKLTTAGFQDVRFCERGGDVGGTWYWNRYPGVACDVESYSYLPLLEEMGYIPTMKFASGFEIFSYLQSVAEKFRFYDHALFHTSMERATWDEASGRWIIETDRGDRMRARYLVLANGVLTSPKLARIDGMESFEGKAFHTSRWDYKVDVRDKRVGIIGTGATSVQAVPQLAKVVKSLHVFQRTPSTIDVRDQRATTPEEIEAWSKEPGWAQARRKRLSLLTSPRFAMQNNDDYLSGKVEREKRKHESVKLSPEEALQAQLNANFRIMEQVRARVDMLVHDKATAEALKPYYSWGCKRPTFHDEYLPTFNLPHVTLVDTAPGGVERITAKGVVHNGVEYPLDVLIYATGFQWMSSATFKSIVGRDGRTLAEKWADEGVKTFLGLHSHGFPNLFVMSGPQSGGAQFNFTPTIDGHGNYVVWLLSLLRDKGPSVFDVRQDAEDDYAAHCREADLKTRPLRDCLSYFNGDGKAEPGSLAYYGGPQAWHDRRIAAQETLDPYQIEPAPADERV